MFETRDLRGASRDFRVPAAGSRPWRGPLLLALLLVAMALPAPADVPVSLDSPDGQGMTMQNLDLRVAVHGMLSLTEMEMVFRNPQPRQMEGKFNCVLPAGATVSRFAKEVGGRLVEGEVVERQRATRVYTQVLHEMRDPALLEQDQGNRFSARVFPIPASGTVRLVLSYSRLVPMSAEGLRVVEIPLLGLPKVENFRVKAILRELEGETLVASTEGTTARTREAQTITQEQKDFTPAADLRFMFRAEKGTPRLHKLRAGDFQLLSYRADPSGVATAPVDQPWTLYADTSASGIAEGQQRVRALGEVLGKLPAATPVRVFAFDIEVSPPLYEGPARDAAAAVTKKLNQRWFLGATDLVAAAKHAGELARKDTSPQRYILVTDGIATLGARTPAEVVAALGAWPSAHRLDAVSLGSRQDETMLRALTEGRGRVVALPLGPKAEATAEAALEALRPPLGPDWTFYDEGAEWSFPRVFRDVQAGQELIAFSALKPDAKTRPGFASKAPDLADRPMEGGATLAGDFAPLLEREAHAAQLAHLEQVESKTTDAAEQRKLRDRRLEISTKHRVLCPLTALLVLESERDYERFGLDRRALADVMIVGADGIERRARTSDELPPPPPPPASPPMFDRLKKLLKMDGPASAAAPQGLARSAAPASAPMPSTGADEAPADAAGAVPEQAEADTFSAEPEEESKSLAGGGGGAADGGLAAPRRSETRADEQAPSEANAMAAPSAAPALPSLEAPPASPPPPPPPPSARARVEGRAAEPSPIPATAGEGRSGPSRVQQVGSSELAWIAEGKAVPDEPQLTQLSKAVTDAPFDRARRNAYADALTRAGKWGPLEELGLEWARFDSENPAVFEHLGRSLAREGSLPKAARAFSSVAEVAPSDAALLSRAGYLLLDCEARESAIQLFREAVARRPDQPNTHRGLALACLLAGRYEEAVQVLQAALKETFHSRYGDIRRVMREELGYALRSWAKSSAPGKERVPELARELEVELGRVDALRVTLVWETDANDVDLHVVDPNGEMCFYSHRTTASGLELYSDQTQGLGPEVIRTGKTLPGDYNVGVKYFSAGPMGVSRGVLVVLVPKEGLPGEVRILPFALVPIPGAQDMRLLTMVKMN